MLFVNNNPILTLKHTHVNFWSTLEQCKHLNMYLLGTLSAQIDIKGFHIDQIDLLCCMSDQLFVLNRETVDVVLIVYMQK